MEFEYRERRFVLNGVLASDHIHRSIEKSATFYELELLEYIRLIVGKERERGREGPLVAIDVGGNIGNHSVYFHSFIVDHVIVCEPNPQVLDTLRRNLAVNRVEHSLRAVALGASTGRGSVVVPPDGANNIGAAAISTDGSDIPISTLDDVRERWASERDACSLAFVKIDVEGMELDVLRGARRTLEELRPPLFVEAIDQVQFDALNAFLHDFGYLCLGSLSRTPVYHFHHQPDRALIRYARLSRARVLGVARLRRWRRSLVRRLSAAGPSDGGASDGGTSDGGTT